MTVFEIDVNGEKRNVYMDGRLYRSIENKIKPKVQKKDYDWVWVVDGPEGSGKSVLAQQIAKLLDPSFCVERMCMTPKEFKESVLRAEKGQCVVFDEAFTGFSSRASLTEVNKILVSLMMEMRQKNLFVIIVMPTIFLLDRYVALFRARGLFHVYLKHGKRGNWVYFNNRKKKYLYLTGKKLFSYSKPKCRFRGSFLDKYTIDEAAYRRKKRSALMEKSRSTKAEGFKAQRDVLFWILCKKFKQNKTQISKLCKEVGYSVDRTTIADAIAEKELALLKKKVNKVEIEDDDEKNRESSTPKPPKIG